MMFFLEVDTGQVLWLKFVEAERLVDYQEGLEELKTLGFIFLSMTIDGRTGLKDLASRYTDKVQVCQFHQIQTVNRYLTNQPKLLPAKQLKTIVDDLTRSDYLSFSSRFNYWLEVHQDFLEEKTVNPQTNRKHYTHKRLRSAVRSIQHNLAYLFTYQTNIVNPAVFLRFNHKPPSDIPNTTNDLDGGVNPKIRELIELITKNCHLNT